METIVEACYEKPEIGLYEGNPLIEALPSINSSDTTIDRLMSFPEYSMSHRSLPLHLRFHYLQQLLQVFIALPRHVVLERKIGVMLRGGYRFRHPHDPRFIAEVSERLKAFRSASGFNLACDTEKVPQGMDLIGVSGVGKSTALRRILSLYPQVIVHTEYNDRRLTLNQIVWLHLECPSNGGVKALCKAFFETVDTLIGTSYLQRFGDSNNDTMMMNMARVATWQSLGLLVIDEVQNVSVAKSGGGDQFLNYIVRLRNEIGLPVILVGTPEAEPILAGKFRNARRGTTWGSISWDRLAEHDESNAPNEEWELFIRAIWRYQYTSKPTLLTPELSTALYNESQGIPDLVVKAYILAQAEAMLAAEECPDETITPDMIRKAARTGFALCQPYLQALRSGDESALLLMKDVRPSIDSRVDQVQAALEQRRLLSLASRKTREELREDRVEGVCSWLVEAGCPYQEASRIAQVAADSLGAMGDDAALRLAAVRLWEGQKCMKTKGGKRNHRPAFAPDSLMEIVRQGRDLDQTGYEALKSGGMVREL